MSDTAPPRDPHRTWSLDELIEPDEFTRRHIGPADRDVAAMLGVIGASSIDELLDQTMPSSIRSDTPLSLSLIHISEPTRLKTRSRMPSSA